MNGPESMAASLDQARSEPAHKPVIDSGLLPIPDPCCLYGLVGQVARTGGEGSEANPYAIAVNFMTYLCSAIGRGVYLPVGNTWHHARLFSLHIGRSGRGRKGDALSLVMRLDEALRQMDEGFAPQVHRGGLSSREGLVALIHDGYSHGQHSVPGIEDKRLWVVESEFANVLHQGRRGGNTLSAALRDCWDGVSLKPATKSNRLYASDPHVCLSGAISPEELTGLLHAREMTNGFANRFLMIWAERGQILPFPIATPQASVDSLARQVLGILQFVQAERHGRRDWIRMEISLPARQHYADLYRGELCRDTGDVLLNAIMERRAPMLLRLAMLFALCDQKIVIEVFHIETAAAWIRYASASVHYVFVGAGDENRKAREAELAIRLVSFLRQRGQATRSEISTQCFKGKVGKAQLDACLDHLLAGSAPQVSQQLIKRPADVAGSPTRVYRLSA